MLSFLALLVFQGCKPAATPTPTGDTDPPTPIPSAQLDNDNDGYTASIDCDDDNATINPGALEICNGIDDDCSGAIDDDPFDGVTAYADADADGYGDADTGIAICGTVPAGFISQGGDCDDSDPHINPDAAEACDDVDADCDGTPGYLDEDAPGDVAYYLDADNDGYGAGNSIQACAPPAGYSTQSGDCDDGAPSTYPGAAEQCDDADNDCDGSVDEDLNGTWYADADDDGYGDAAMSIDDCLAPFGYVADSTDCDDDNDARYPGALEICDTYDNDCDTYIDDEDPEGPIDAPTFYTDGDLDGYGTGEGLTQCDQPPDTVDQGGDCDDTRDYVYPGADEVCDTYDNDCDTYADDEDPEGVDDGTRFYMDLDVDGYGDPLNYVDACLPPPDVVANGEDCDDTRNDVYPGAVEVCNGGIDDNCDGVIDDDDPEALLGTWYVDADDDGYGDDVAPTLTQCDQPPGYAPQGGDCDELRDDVYPGADEVCDTYDNDCDGFADDADPEGVVDGEVYYYDSDIDGYGADPGFYACEEPPDVITTGGDCDDENAEIYPGADEICDTYDNDCDTYIDADDDGLLGGITAYRDEDFDGYGFGDLVAACELVEGYVENADDCDDARDYVYPGADEVCDTYDNDCDTLIDDDDIDVIGDVSAYLDDDGDGYGADPSVLVCNVVAPYIDQGGDCNDTDPLIRPGAFDWGDGVDQNCNGDLDEDVGTESYDAADVQLIWNGSCGPCHTASSAGGLNLSDGYASTVNVPSNDFAGIDQIEPGSPVGSYIWASLTNTRGQVGGAGGIMPPGGPLAQGELDLIETWILQGAPESIAP